MKKKLKDIIEFWFGKVLSIALLIIAIVTASLAFSTLNEMQYQRNKSLEPDLMVLETYVRYCGDSSSDFKKQTYEGIDNIKSFEVCKDNTFGNRFELINIGLGAAKNIRIFWDLDSIENYREIFESLDAETSYSEAFASMFGFMEMKYGEGYSYINDDIIERVDYILPIYNQGKDYFISYPEYYLYMNSIVLSTYTSTLPLKDDYLLPIVDWPMIEGRLEYEDIQGNRIIKKIRLVNNVLSYKIDENGNYEAIVEIWSNIIDI